MVAAANGPGSHTIDLLNPVNLQSNYVQQVHHTMEAYAPPLIAFGEALQNALDAVMKAGPGKHLISVEFDFDRNRVEVEDSGIGFPNAPELLYLGGSQKSRREGAKMFGMIGVGMKVILFSSSHFLLKARSAEGACFVELDNAYRFAEDPPPAMVVPDPLPTDLSPLEHQGTRLSYAFPDQATLNATVELIRERCLPRGAGKDFGLTLAAGVNSGRYPCRFAALLDAFLRRFTYCGDVLRGLGHYPHNEIEIRVTVKCSDPVSRLGSELAALFDDLDTFDFSCEPTYLRVEETLIYSPPPKPAVFSDGLGNGGQNLQLTASGFNVNVYASPDEYESLLRDVRGNLPDDIDEYRSKLFPRVNSIVLTIGRIPAFERFLPGGSARVIAANGVVTSHQVEFSRGRNQQYVRCFDIIVDVDATLNYGKTNLADTHLVNRINRFLNEAYGRCIQNAAARFVGIPAPEPTERDIFLERTDLGASGLSTTKVPRDENDVIALFFELVGRGVIEDYRFYGLSQQDTYDARAAIRTEAAGESAFTPTRDTDLAVVEFKVHAANIFSDLERQQKNVADMDLLIAWDEGTNTSNQFAFADIDHSAAASSSPSRTYPQVTRYLQDARTGREVQVLLLEQVLEQMPGG